MTSSLRGGGSAADDEKMTGVSGSNDVIMACTFLILVIFVRIFRDLGEDMTSSGRKRVGSDENCMIIEWGEGGGGQIVQFCDTVI